MPHANELQRKSRKEPEETFALDGKFLRDEAREAIRSYFMPFAGIYAAAVGKDVRVVGIKETKGKSIFGRVPTQPTKAKRKKA
jgi:hypothetical protein